MTELQWLWLDRITIVTAAVAAVVACFKSVRLFALSRQAEERRRTEITIQLIEGKRTFDLPYRPRRDQLSRQELAGLLGFYYGENRFDPVVVRRVLESGALSRVLGGVTTDGQRENVLKVEVDANFFDQVVSRYEASKAVDREKPANEGQGQPKLEIEARRVDRLPGRIWNLTPHAMHYDDGEVVRTIESDGMLRLEQEDQPADAIAGMRVVRTRYGKPGGLPAGIAAGDTLIVSTLVGDSWEAEDRPPGVTVIVPDTGNTCKRDSAGRIVSVSRFICK